MGSKHRIRHGHPSEHRLPLPDGAVLLAVPSDRLAGLDRATTLARLDHPRGRPRHAVPIPHARRPRRRRGGRRTRVHAQSVLARLRSPNLGAVVAVGRIALVARAPDPRFASRRLATRRLVRIDRADHRGRQRDRAALHRYRSVALARAFGLRGERGKAPTGDLHRTAVRVPDGDGVTVVDRRAVGSRVLRHQHLEVHRDPPCGLTDLAAERGLARSRLLVLLRQGQARSLDRSEPHVHPTSARHPDQLRHPCPRALELRVRDVEVPQLLHLDDRRGRRHRRGCSPLRQPDAPRGLVQRGRRDLDCGLRPPEHRACDAIGDPRSCRTARCRRERTRPTRWRDPTISPAGAGGGAGRRWGPRGPQPARALERHVLWHQPPTE